MSDDELTPRPSRPSSHSQDDTERQIAALTELVGMLSTKVTALTERLDTLDSHVDAGQHTTDDGDDADEDRKKDTPAPWVLYSPPAAAEDQRHRDDGHDPRFTLENFVAWYNATYVGPPGHQATPIPACWREHPPLAMEIATLAYAWRRANIGPGATVRDAQQWHHQHRPGFTARMAIWVHTRCLDGNHQNVGAPARTDRFGPTASADDRQSQ